MIAPALVKRYGKGTDSDTTATLIASTLKSQRGKGGGGIGRRSEDDPNLVAQPLRSNPHNNSDPGMEARMHVYQGASVRRLMPVECERLQALPDGWTDLGGTADSKRYAALGDAVTASVTEWIGRRLIDASV